MIRVGRVQTAKLDAPDLVDAEAWTWPLSGAEFADGHWTKVPFFEPGAPARLAPILKIFDRWTADEILTAHDGKAIVSFPTPDGDLMTAVVPPLQALKFYGGGMTACATNHARVRDLARDVMTALGAHPARVESNIYLSSRGCRTPLHFDCSESVVLQVQGRKTWRVAPNESIAAPVRNSGITGDIPFEVRRDLRAPLPRDVPASAITYELEPGGILYVPRGFWHATESDGDSVSLHFHYQTLTWLDVILPAIRARLECDPKWREAARAVGPRTHGASTLNGEVATLLANLSKAAREMPAEDAFEFPGDSPLAPTRYRRNPMAALWANGASEDDGVAACSVQARSSFLDFTAHLELDAPSRALAYWMASRDVCETVAASDVARQFGVSEGDARDVLEVLAAARLVRAART